MKKYTFLIAFIILVLSYSFTFALNWTGSQWTDNPVFMRSGYVVMSVLEVTGDASFDGSLYISGSMDVSTDLTLNTVTVGGDATFDQSVFIGDSLDVSEDLSSNTLDVTVNTTIGGDATCDGALFVGGGADISDDCALDVVTISSTLTVSGDATFDQSIFIGADLDVSEDLTATTFVVTDVTADSIYVSADVDVSEDLTANTIIIAGDATFDQSVYILDDLDVSNDLTTNTITVSGDVSCDSTVSINNLLIYQPSATQIIDGTDDAILANAVLVVLNPDADYTTDVTPTIAAGTIGQMLYIICADGEANRVRVQDNAILPGALLELDDTYRDISGKGILTLMFNGTNWIEQGYSDN